MGFFDVTSGPSISFPTVGTRAGGTIAAPYTERQSTEFGTDKPKTDSKGEAVMMACVELATSERDASIPNDDGVRTLYVDKVGLKIAIGEAVKASGASDLEVGATLFVTWTGEAPSSKGSPLKTWSAEYTRPTGSLGVKPAATPPAAASAGPDLLANARAAAAKLEAETVAMEAKSKAPAAGHDPAADIAKVKELLALGIPVAAVHTAMPAYSFEAITAISVM